MRRLVASLSGLGLAACTTFAFSPPGGTTDDAAATDATTAIDAPPDFDGGIPGLLDLTSAARVCALTFECPRLAAAIEASIVMPVNTPASPLNFSACVDWLAGPIDPARIGLAAQKAILAGLASAQTCADAYAAVPVHPVATGGTCAATSCADAATFETCVASAGAFTVSCGAPVFAQGGACVASGTGALCISAGACTFGATCRDASTVVDCYKGGVTFTAYDCSLSARRCADDKQGAATCVVGSALASPCPGDGIYDSCAGASVVHCAGGRFAQTEIDCAKVGRTCSQAGGGAARCVGSGDSCTPFDLDGKVNACGDAGSDVSLCVAGQRATFDCSSIGRRCVAASGTQTAHCGQ